MKCRAHNLIRAQRKINKTQSDGRWLSEDDRKVLYEQGKEDPDIKDLVSYNQQRQLETAEKNFKKSLEELKSDTKDVEE